MSDPHTPISEKQFAANRANARHSTGPRSPQGKARSACNARKHGFTASTFAVVRLEDLDEIARLEEDLVLDYRPVNSQELFAIERIALAQQTLLRVARLEAGLFTNALDEALTSNDQQMVFLTEELTRNVEVTRQQNRNYVLAFGFHRIAQKANTWSLYLRYAAQAERQYRRAIEEFERLKRLRPDLPNEPICEVEAEPASIGSDGCTEPVSDSTNNANEISELLSNRSSDAESTREPRDTPACISPVSESPPLNISSR